jgi:hypothetical protein
MARQSFTAACAGSSSQPGTGAATHLAASLSAARCCASSSCGAPAAAAAAAGRSEHVRAAAAAGRSSIWPDGLSTLFCTHSPCSDTHAAAGLRVTCSPPGRVNAAAIVPAGMCPRQHNATSNGSRTQWSTCAQHYDTLSCHLPLPPTFRWFSARILSRSCCRRIASSCSRRRFSSNTARSCSSCRVTYSGGGGGGARRCTVSKQGWRQRGIHACMIK